MAASTRRPSWPLRRSRAVSSWRLKSRPASRASAAARTFLTSPNELGEVAGASGFGGRLTRRSLALLRRQQLGPQRGLDLGGGLAVLLQVRADVFLALADALAVVRVPGAGLLDQVLRDAQLDDLTFARDAGAVHDLELGLAERRRNLVLDDLDARLVADDLFTRLDRADAT